MKWHEISKERPPHGELIWIWDTEKNEEFLHRYMGSEQTWIERKNDKICPIWRPLNEPESNKGIEQ